MRFRDAPTIDLLRDQSLVFRARFSISPRLSCASPVLFRGVNPHVAVSESLGFSFMRCAIVELASICTFLMDGRCIQVGMLEEAWKQTIKVISLRDGIVYLKVVISSSLFENLGLIVEQLEINPLCGAGSLAQSSRCCLCTF